MASFLDIANVALALFLTFIFAAFFLYLNLRPERAREFVRHHVKNSKRANFILSWLELLIMKTKGIIPLVVLSAVLSIALELTLSYFFSQPLQALPVEVLTNFILSGIAAPLGEETLWRGIICGLGIVVVEHRKLTGNWRLMALAVPILYSSLFFTFSHNTPTVFHIMVRFLPSILYGILFVWKRNLLLPISAHAAANLFTLLLGPLGF